MHRYSFDTVQIDGFRGLRHLKLSEMGLVNILVGENNSGKTSVLEALSILCNPLEPLEWMAMIRRRDFGGLDESRVQSLRWCFPQSGQLVSPDVIYEGQCQMSCEGRFPLRSLAVTIRDIEGEPDAREVTRRAREREEDMDVTEPRRGAELAYLANFDAAASSAIAPESAGADKSQRIAIEIWDNTLYFGRPVRRGPHVPAQTLTPYSYQINRLQVRTHSQHILSRTKSTVLELIREFDPDVESIELASLRGRRPAIYLGHRRLGPAPLSIFGDALRRAVLLATTLPTLRDGGVLLIDEIETGIHISALQRVISWLVRVARSMGVQVVATTHSLEAVDALVGADPQNVDDIVTFHLEQTEAETKVKRTAGELLYRLRYEGGLDVR